MFSWLAGSAFSLMERLFMLEPPDANNILKKMEEGGGGKMEELENKISDIGGGGYRIAFMIACFVFAIGLIIFFVKMFTANAQERSFMKWDIIWKAAAIACAFGAVAIVAMLAKFGKDLFKEDSASIRDVPGIEWQLDMPEQV